MTRFRWLLLLLAVACLVSVGVAVTRHRPAPAAGPTPPPHLAVLNGTDRPGLARRVALRLAAAGVVVDRVGNAPHDRFRRTLLVNDRLSPDAARHLAARLGGIPVVPEADPARSEDALLVLGADVGRVLSALAGGDDTD